MDKLFNTLSVLIAFIGGFISSLLGGFDLLVSTILMMVIFDYITGILKSIVDKKLSSKVGFKGICKKIMLFIIIATANQVQALIGNAIPLREITLMFFISNEGLSILENVSEFLPLPDKLKEIFIQLRDKGKE